MGEPVAEDVLLPDRRHQAGGQLEHDRPHLLGLLPHEHQGISAGWGDQYHHELAGQELEVTGAPPGVYYMVSIANPEGRYLETTTTNNTAWSSFRLTRDSMGKAKITEISHSPCSGTLCGEDIPNR